MKRISFFLLLTSVCAFANLPVQFDLRNAGGMSYVSSIKNQSGGTCWAHAIAASLEGNLMKTGIWKASETGEPNLAEYHMDWWNGFNTKFNPDAMMGASGLTVHQGGDYRVGAAYLALGGMVRDIDGQSFNTAPVKHKDTYRYFYPRDIEWFQIGDNLENIERIKETIMNHGVIGTALTWSNSFFNGSTFFQPKSSSSNANHAVSIVGWDDNKVTQAPRRGAWLAKNSWGQSFGDAGYFWISYYDKITARHAEMGAIAHKNVERLKYNGIYSHDAHGWRDTKKTVNEAFNAFVAKGNPLTGRETLQSVSFYTAADNASYKVQVYSTFAAGELKGLLSVHEGSIANTGFHTIDLSEPVHLTKGDKFYIHVTLSQGGHAFDRTSDVPVLLGAEYRVIVPSKASPGESYYRLGSQWRDLTADDASANFCIKGLTVY